MHRQIANRVAATSIILALSFDFLFWNKPVGVNYPLFTLLTASAGILVLSWLGHRPARRTWPLIVLSIVASLGIAVRAEPLSQFLSFVSTWMLLGIAASSLTVGDWPWYGFRDYLKEGFRLVAGALSSQVEAFRLIPAADTPDISANRKKGFALLRGLLLAAPVLLVFSSLLASADPLFDRWLSTVLAWLDIERLPEYLFRMIYVLFGAYLLAGVFFFANRTSQTRRVGQEASKPLVPLLGSIEANTILTLVAGLFLVFVTFQFRYFFGGRLNVNLAGYTYSEYARRGFAELVVVSVFSLMLMVALSSVTNHQSSRSRTLFSGLNVALVALLAVILLSSTQRLTLYEGAYGFTRLRTYTHVFIIWLGLLLAAVAALEVSQRTRHLALACLLAATGYVASLIALNVDVFIVRENVARFEAGQPLDVAYLASLSEDALPEIARLWSAAETTSRGQLAAALVCHAEIHAAYQPDLPWQSLHLSRLRADKLWQAIVASGRLDLSVYEDKDGFYGWHYVVLEGEKIWCESDNWD
ncbi:MAG: DUF4173 domain-containing protein [Chloroflexi bacterium]|nr:DUF4173 domain-containing protein [Chloroflexota bacterium]